MGFIANFNGQEAIIHLRKSRGDYRINRVKKRVFSKFDKLGTRNFQIFCDRFQINNEDDVSLYLLGQEDNLPKAHIFIGLPQFESEFEDDSYSKSECYSYSMRTMSDLLNNQESKEYICCFNDCLGTLTLTMRDITKYSDSVFESKFLSLFDYKLKNNELLQFKVYDIFTKQFVDITKALYSYDSSHYHIEGMIVKNTEENEYEYDTLNGLESDIISKQKHFETLILRIKHSINSNEDSFECIKSWKDYNFELRAIESDIVLFCNEINVKLKDDLLDNLNSKCLKLKALCCTKLNVMNDCQQQIDCNKAEMIECDEAIRQLTLRKIQCAKQINESQIKMKRQENELKCSQQQIKKLETLHYRPTKTKKKLGTNIVSFAHEKKKKINKIQKHLNHIWQTFEQNYDSWTIEEVLYWIKCISNFHFSQKSCSFFDKLRKHQFVGKNLKELQSVFTLKLMGLTDTESQQILIQNINRIISESDTNIAMPSTTSDGNVCYICAKKLTIKSCPTCRHSNIKIMTTYKSGL